jgi:hypothetical protein
METHIRELSAKGESERLHTRTHIEMEKVRAHTRRKIEKAVAGFRF